MIDRWSVAAAHADHVVRRPPERLWGRCPASARLTVSEAARLAALPSTVDPALQPVLCELAAGHGGSHAAFAVAGSLGERWWWLRWSADLRALVEAHPCECTQNHGPHRDECMLPGTIRNLITSTFERRIKTGPASGVACPNPS